MIKLNKTISLLLLLGLVLGQYDHCYQEVQGQMSYNTVSSINYQTYPQAQAACYLSSTCQSIMYMQINQSTKAYQLAGALQAINTAYPANCLNVYSRISNCVVNSNNYVSSSTTAPYVATTTPSTYSSGSSYTASIPTVAYNGSSATYTAPTTEYATSTSYTAQPATYATPSAAYVAPSATYTAPSATYTAPSATYTAPSAAYIAPSATYSGSSTYTAPSQSYSSSSCTYNPNQSTSYVQNIYGGKLYNTQNDAEFACSQYDNCLGYTQINASQLGVYNQISSNPQNLYVLGNGYLVPDNTNTYLNSYVKSSSCKSVQRCNYNLNMGHYSQGCVQNCRDYSTLEEAQAACYNDSSCLAITYASKIQGGSASVGYGQYQYGYQLRGSAIPIASNRYEHTYVKGSCDSNSYSNYQQPDDVCSPTISYDSYLPGCIDNCVDYATLEQALTACGTYQGCGGVTYSRMELGGSLSSNAYNGYGGYQLRASNNYLQSSNGEISYLLPNNCSKYRKTKSQCQYKQDYRMEYNQNDYKNSQVYTTYSNAQDACTLNSGCYGIYADQLNNQYRISTGKAYLGQVAYLKGTCYNDVNQVYPILYSQCNYGGTSYQLNGDQHSLDLSQYQSIYIPENYSLSVYGPADSQGYQTQYDIRSSVICKGSLSGLLKNYQSGQLAKIVVNNYNS